MTSNELAISNPTSVVAAPSSLSISGALAEQVEQMGLAYKLAQSLCKTALVPQTFRGKPEDGAVAIMAGAKWGLDAISSLQNIFIVHGSPSTYARVMKAVVQANGHKMWTVESSPTKVVVRGQRKGEDAIEESVWTTDRAKPYAKTNSKYQTEPENMLYARATAECARRTAPDCLLGMPYSREEMEDTQPRYVQNTSDGAGSVARSLGIGVQSAEPEKDHGNGETEEQSPDNRPVDVSDYVEPPADDTPPEPEPKPASVPTGKKISAAKLKALHAAFGNQKMTDRQEKLDWLGNLLNRDITSTEDLTDAEASLALDTLS